MHGVSTFLYFMLLFIKRMFTYAYKQSLLECSTLLNWVLFAHEIALLM